MSQQPQSWAFFDFDDTLIKGDSILYWRKYFYRKKPLLRVFQIIDIIAILLHVFRIIDAHTLKRFFFIPACYVSSSELNRLAEDFTREEIAPRLYPDIINIAFAHHKLGHEIVIISASSLFYLNFISMYLPPCKIIGTEWEFPDNSPIRFPRYKDNQGNIKGENKLVQIRSRNDLPSTGEKCFSYSDNIVDRFLLTYSQYPSVIHPDKLLKKLAEDNDWPVLKPGNIPVKFLSNFGKLIDLVFVLPTMPPEELPNGDLKLKWGRPSYFPLRWFIMIKDRVNSVHPEDGNIELHHELFSGFPTLNELQGLIQPVKKSLKNVSIDYESIVLLEENDKWIFTPRDSLN